LVTRDGLVVRPAERCARPLRSTFAAATLATIKLIAATHVIVAQRHFRVFTPPASPSVSQPQLPVNRGRSLAS
jgi:hypothetical protein